ncbi:DEAD/DEAH box helicase [Actinoalloteichus sp. GBA129-24]|uniref:DEAD/DEAH box helicase n=1 Tax=Actinoalloteichus sp. GBA129-24 TaxID=1612551 RepID=UPI00095093D0|nr:DEAD/DEAH box helicase [Actinoalloteichus sp. GBA129-24]APU22556.1 helicase family protein [Actinoalloteichus sp. GBA129-24]
MTASQETGWPPGGHILVRDEVWLIRSAARTQHDGDKIRAVGVSGLVRDQEATFFTAIERTRGNGITLLRPEDTTLVTDSSPRFRSTRLFLEAVLRKTPLPRRERGLAMSEGFLLDVNPYQQRPAELALRGLRPRILIADVVGLGKTLEIGLTLAELIRRGRGERILVVTPQQILEQFQREMWTRFSIPLIRLDSVGIQRIARDIPAGRNPFTYYKRVIISIDTLKNVEQYRHHLEKIHWDAVVIDESHNLIGSSSLRSRLARVLEPRTDALVLASATPHNGDMRSFAELISLLDRSAIADPEDYAASDIEHVYVRRTKISPEVRDHITDTWAERGPSVPIRCAASPAEEAVFAELTDSWLAEGVSPASGKDRRLFPYILLKSFLSSHRSLAETVDRRLTSLADRPGESVEVERAALNRLRTAVAAVQDEDSAKLAALVARLRELGVGPGSKERVVVFSERVPTLEWLATVLPGRLGFAVPAKGDEKNAAVRVLHGGVSDKDEQSILADFGRQEAPVRVLLTGDIASEGVNLHEQCHQLVHYDLPWSLIRIEQRNGRIDRFGQEHSPEFAALILTSEVPGAKDDRTVAEKLLKKEEDAHRSLGTAETVIGVHDARKEEDRLTRELLADRDIAESLAGPSESAVLDGLLDQSATASPPAPPLRVSMPSLFADTEAFVTEALHELYGDRDALNIAWENGALILTPPEDLLRRLSVLPPEYVRERRLKERLHLIFDQGKASERLEEAKMESGSHWPTVAFASDLHPAVEWLVDKLLVRYGRQRAPVLRVDVEEPVFLIQGMFSNALGQPTAVEWLAVTGLPGRPVCGSMFEVLAERLGPGTHNPGGDDDVSGLTALLPQAIDAARVELNARRGRLEAEVAAQLEEHEARVSRFENQLELFDDEGLRGRRRGAREAVDAQRQLSRSLQISGEPFLRVLGVLQGRV